MIGLLAGLLILIVFGSLEYFRNKKFRNQIPEIIHVNGTRGKSSVTRLIAAGLRAGGKKVIAKTTGSAPVLIFEDGSETPIFRHHGANIKEQTKIIKFAANRDIDILVLECMAVTPEYQWVTEHEIVKSTVGVITNSRPDHLDVMGPGIRNVTISLCNTIPYNGRVFTAEKKMLPLMNIEAEKRNSKILSADEEVDNSDMQAFSYIEHKENVALALQVCRDFKIDKETALSGMYEALPDVGAMEIYQIGYQKKKLFFVHAFAANDPESTAFVIESVKKLHPHLKTIVIVLSTRADRMFRSKQLIRMMTAIEFDHLFLIGEQTNSIAVYAGKQEIPRKKTTNCGWISGEKLSEKISGLTADEILILGIGNIGGNGGIIVNYFKENRGKNV